MNATAINNFVKRHKRIGLDTNILIGWIEKDQDYSPAVEKVFAALDRTHSQVIISVVSITEVLILPLKNPDQRVANQYHQFLAEADLQFSEVTASTARSAAIIGSQYNFKLGDALLLASLIESKITGFVTADKAFKKLKSPDVLLLQ